MLQAITLLYHSVSNMITSIRSVSGCAFSPACPLS
ncbi:hypothetical protein PSHT_01160 [Puccinia striiformis]|uniref:Uncharacterized protein n=2 Tax=Puccinia striiformis TaxID=27350 RepID=A0A2S4W2S4_9BASI|nr:hypothetical protein PSTT_01648 [Puccinia striiformis]POW22520.1 hypothetical protein PSHT_01160 [Puccinia striiformis]